MCPNEIKDLRKKKRKNQQRILDITVINNALKNSEESFLFGKILPLKLTIPLVTNNFAF